MLQNQDKTTERDVDFYGCRQCRFNAPGSCKRVDRINIIPYAPWFVCDPESRGMICADFLPKKYMIRACDDWTTFADYWPKYVEQHLPYQNTNRCVYVFIGKNRDISYGIPLLEWVFGKPIENGILKAVNRKYYKRRMPTKENSFIYKLIKEPINGVSLNEIL